MNKRHHSRPKRRRHSKPRQNDLPKGGYRLPTGEIARKITYTDHRGRHIAVIGIRREKPDLELLAKAIVQVAIELDLRGNRVDRMDD